MRPIYNVRGAIAATPRRTWGWLVFWVALAYHAGYVYDLRTNTDHGIHDYHVVQSMAFGDAVTWHEMGKELSRGWGWTQWRARRPLYGWFLGGLYTLLPAAATYDVALAFNVWFTALAIALIFASMARLYGMTVALGVAGAVIFDRQTLLCSSVTLTEALGLALLAGHFWLLVVACQEQRLRPLVWSGVLFALSNATRTLTLFAAPLYVALLAWHFYVPGKNWLRGAVAAGGFGAAAGLVIASFMTQNYLRNGIFSLSDNTAGDLYAVTAPEFGSWSPQVLAHMNNDLNLWTEKEIYDYQMREARANIRKHTRLFLSRISRNLAHTSSRLLMLNTPWLWAFWGLAWLVWPDHRPQGRWIYRILGLAPAAAIYSVYGRAALLVAAVLLALAGRPRREARLLAALFLGSLLAIGMFGSRMERLFVLFQWTFVALQMGALGHYLAWTRRGVMAARLVDDHPTQVWFLPRSPTRAVAAAMTLLACLVIYRNTLGRERPVTREEITPTFTELAEAAIRRTPDLFTPHERIALRHSSIEPLTLGGRTIESHGDLVAIHAYVDALYYFPALAPPQVAPDAHVRARLYPFTVVRAGYRGPSGGMVTASYVFPGDLRYLSGKPVCLLGRINRNAVNDIYAQGMVWTVYSEGIAWCPWTGDSVRADVRAAQFAADEPAHRRQLEKFIPRAAPSDETHR